MHPRRGVTGFIDRQNSTELKGRMKTVDRVLYVVKTETSHISDQIIVGVHNIPMLLIDLLIEIDREGGTWFLPFNHF